MMQSKKPPMSPERVAVTVTFWCVVGCGILWWLGVNDQRLWSYQNSYEEQESAEDERIRRWP